MPSRRIIYALFSQPVVSSWGFALLQPWIPLGDFWGTFVPDP